MRADLSAAIQRGGTRPGRRHRAALITGDRSAIDADNQRSAPRLRPRPFALCVRHSHGHRRRPWCLRSLWTLSLIPPIALRVSRQEDRSHRRALCGARAYLIISGSAFPALRSFVMACSRLRRDPARSARHLHARSRARGLHRRADLSGVRPRTRLPDEFRRHHGARRFVRNAEARAARARAADAGATHRRTPSDLNARHRRRLSDLVRRRPRDRPIRDLPLPAFLSFTRCRRISSPRRSCRFSSRQPPRLSPPSSRHSAGRHSAASDGQRLDLIAAIGQTFGERPEAIRAVPRPPDAAFHTRAYSRLLWAASLARRAALAWRRSLFRGKRLRSTSQAPTPDRRVRFRLARASTCARADRWTARRRKRPLHLRTRSPRRDARPLRHPKPNVLRPRKHAARAFCTVAHGGSSRFALVRSDAAARPRL